MAKKPLPKRSIPSQTKSKSPEKRSGEATSGGSRWEPKGWLIPALVCLALTAIVYLPSLKNGFVNWDDEPNIIENANLKQIDAQSIRNIFDIDKGNVIGNYNPLAIFSFAMEKKIAGEFNTMLIHSTNLVLHLLTVLFAIRVLLHLGIGIWGAFMGGMLFGIHPMRVESVAWATERKDVLFAVFFFAALMYYIRWVKTEDSGKRLRLYLLMLVLALLSNLSKVQAVTLPLSMLAIDYLVRRPINLRLIWEKIPFWGLSLAFGLINLYTLRQQGSTNDDVTDFNFIDRLCIGAYSFCVYLYKIFIPYPMSPLYPYPKPLPVWVYLAPIAFFAIWFGIYRMYKTDRRWWVFGMLFFFFNVMFLLQVLGAGQGFLADRFTYVPYFGLFAIAAWAYDRYAQQESVRSGMNIAAGLVFLIFAIVSYRQIGIWKDGGTLWTHVMKYEKLTNSLPYWNRGQFYRGQGNFDASLKDYSQAIKINPKNPELYNSRGKTHFDMAMSEQYKSRGAELVRMALQDYDTGLALPDIKPKVKSEMLINRGAARGSTNDFNGALEDLNAGLELDPDNKNGYFNRSLVYFNLRQYEKAVEDYTSYLKYDPYNVNVWYERGMIRRSIGNNQEAIEDLSQALKLNPNFGLAYMERARAYAQMGNKASAQQDYQKAAQFQLQMQPFDQQLMSREIKKMTVPIGGQ